MIIERFFIGGLHMAFGHLEGTSATKELNSKVYLMLINLKVNLSEWYYTLLSPENSCDFLLCKNDRLEDCRFVLMKSPFPSNTSVPAPPTGRFVNTAAVKSCFTQFSFR